MDFSGATDPGGAREINLPGAVESFEASGDDLVRAAAAEGRITTVPLRCEHKAEEWHFDGPAHSAQIQDEQRKAQEYRKLKALASELQHSIATKAEQHLHEVLGSAEDVEALHCQELSALREELVEVQAHVEELRDDCEKQILEIEGQIREERQTRHGIEAQMREERKQADKARQRLDEIEEHESTCMRDKERSINQHRIYAHNEVRRMQQEADQQVRTLEKKLREETAALQRELDQALKVSRSQVSSKIGERQQVLENGKETVRRVDKQVATELSQTHQELLELQEETFAKMEQVQVRDFAHEAFLQETISAVHSAFACAEEEKYTADMIEQENRDMAEEAVDIFGTSFPRSYQYQMPYDRQLRSAMSEVAGQA
eukprot:gnl/TRDRNA2_/TRDRNA2_36975_c0_seq1.p1 gnl/TRDRNA2_/TRDRNA2_36975_c0~~gnl/TRDRNA2_/TRDRNA2_36975_c0_seq1.p1  ORF type:complete len:375 (+),score=112.68 gnl/TRDRNA2_/TRDRNA2_36975_c0_seq1:77-1201(+)